MKRSETHRTQYGSSGGHCSEKPARADSGIAARYGARNLRVLASRAREQADSDSDLDVLIDLVPGRSLLDIISIKQDLEDLIGCRVDVVTEVSLSPYIRDEILREAVLL